VASVSRKPLSIALEEIAAGKVKGVREPESEEDAVEGDGDDAEGPVIDAGGGDADPVA
jgi:hypothetical protein